MTNPAPTYRIVCNGKQLRDYQTAAHRDAFIAANDLTVVDQCRDSITFNLFTVYVEQSDRPDATPDYRESWEYHMDNARIQRRRELHAA